MQVIAAALEEFDPNFSPLKQVKCYCFKTFMGCCCFSEMLYCVHASIFYFPSEFQSSVLCRVVRVTSLIN